MYWGNNVTLIQLGGEDCEYDDATFREQKKKIALNTICYIWYIYEQIKRHLLTLNYDNGYGNTKCKKFI